MEEIICQGQNIEPPGGDARTAEEDSEPPDPVELGFYNPAISSIAPIATPLSAGILSAPDNTKNLIKSRHLAAKPQFTVSPGADAFRRRFFPQATKHDWNDWHWQLKHRIQSGRELSRFIELSEREREVFGRKRHLMPLSITPYYASLLDPTDDRQPLRRSVVPLAAESLFSAEEVADPLGEDHDSPVPGIVHRYPDRVLFLVTSFCSTYCRYCTRSRMVGQSKTCRFDTQRLSAAMDYIRRTPSVRDVLLSGGDPLTLSNDRLEWILSRLRAIPHVEMIRIGSKVPAVLPQRITTSLVRMLKRYHPLWMSLHFTHPAELTPEALHACNRLADGGIPLGSQTVLLSGINDDVRTMKALFQGLLKMRVRPYYLYQCDPIPGSSHFRTPVEKGLDIIAGLRGHTSGYAVPTYVIDAPAGGGKIPLLPEYVLGKDETGLVLRNYEGRRFCYPDHDHGSKGIEAPGELRP